MGQSSKIEILQRPTAYFGKVPRTNKSQANLTVPYQGVCKHIDDTICVAQHITDRQKLSVTSRISERYPTASVANYEN